MAQKFDARQTISRDVLSQLLGINGTELDDLLRAINKEFNAPLRISASSPADSKINFQPSEVEAADLAAKNITPVSSQIPSFPASTIDFQTGATTGGTINITFPNSTVGFFRRIGFSLDASGTIQAIFSAEAATIGALDNAGTVFVKGALPIGWIDLEATAASPGRFKTAGSATNIIENKVGSDNRVHRIMGGGGSGSGSGVGSKSFFSDYNCEDITLVTTYDDTTAIPVDGTGSIATGLTTALETTTPLTGTKSYKLSKDNSNRQGKGFAILTDETLDYTVKQGESVTIQFKYQTSANYVSGDIKMFLYRVGSNTLEALNGVDGLGNFGNSLNADQTGRGTFTATTSLSSSDTAVRVLFHVASASALAYDLTVDNVFVGTNTQVITGINSLSEFWTPTFVGLGTVSLAYARWWRENEWLNFDVKFITGTPTTVSAGFTLPNNLVIDSAATGTPAYVGEWKRATTNQFSAGALLTNTANGPYIYFGHAQSMSTGATGAPTNPAQGTQISGGSEDFICSGRVKIQGWSAGNTISSTQAMFQNVIAGVYRATSSQAIGAASYTKIQFNGVHKDSFNAFDETTNYRFTAVSKLPLQVDYSIAVAGLSGAGELAIRLVKNGSVLRETTTQISAATASGGIQGTFTDPDTAKGDYYELHLFSSTACDLLSDSTIYGGSTATFKQIPDLTVVGISGAPSEYKSAVSSIKTPVASGHWLQMTGNSLTLDPGEWEITGYTSHYSGPSSASYSYLQTNLRAANGTDSVVAPNSLGAVPGLTMKGLNNDMCFGGYESNMNDVSRNYRPIYISMTSTGTIYAVPYATMSTPANSRIVTYIAARRLK